MGTKMNLIVTGKPEGWDFNRAGEQISATGPQAFKATWESEAELMSELEAIVGQLSQWGDSPTTLNHVSSDPIPVSNGDSAALLMAGCEALGLELEMLLLGEGAEASPSVHLRCRS